MTSWLQRLEPSLNGSEVDYRQHYLREDIHQIVTLVMVWMFSYLGFAFTDFFTFGAGELFYSFLTLRVVYIFICLLVIYLLLKHVRRYQIFDQIVILWSACSIGWGVIIGLSQPIDLMGTALVDLVAVVSFYLFVPNGFYIRVIPPLVFSLFSLLLLVALRVGANTALIYAALYSFIVTNLLGIIFSIRLYASRRRVYQARREEEKIRAELQRLASTDPLTGILNRRWILELADEAFYRFRRYHRPFSILVMDLDGFKNVNDTLGHQKGDAMLIAFTGLVSQHKRAADAFGRMGGDEFCLVLPESLPDAAIALAERILMQCQDISASDGNQEVSVTVSIGISHALVQDSTLDAVFARADKALYAAKRAGRNRWEKA